MPKHKNVSRESRRLILSEIHKILQEYGRITIDEAVNLIQPHFNFDSLAAKEQLMKRTANRYIASIKDAENVRQCFSSEKNEFIDVENCINLKDLENILTHLENRRSGINASITKVKKCVEKIEGQISFQELSKSS